MGRQPCIYCIILLAVAGLGFVFASASPGNDLLEKLTLAEKASLVTGRNATQTREIERLGIPSVQVADGPVGVRKKTGRDRDETYPATCFPSPSALAATWDPALVERVGAAIGAEARALGIRLLLAPGLNIKRHPYGGRNFEYYSEDPRLSGELAAAFVEGVQSTGVGATLKHFAANNQETRRMSIDVRVSERTLREIYLRGFEIALDRAKPRAVMSAYNAINGRFASENEWLLTNVLRDDWGFEGLVVSDWGAVDDPVAALAAGLDLEMPGNRFSPAKIVEAVQSGRLDEAQLDRAVGRVLDLVGTGSELGSAPSVDFDAHHELAREAAAAGMVLLENRGGFLPVGEATPERSKLAITGTLAAEPRIQGTGSSQVHATRTEAALPFLEEKARERGFTVAYLAEDTDRTERAAMESFVMESDFVLVFAGQRASQDSEAADRSSTALAPADLRTIEIVAASGKPFAVVLVGGSSLDVEPFAKDADAVLMTWLGGQAWSSAVTDVIFGERAPAGKLAETFALRADDHASALNFPGGRNAVRYGEELFVGYRYFATFERPVAYPFGHGLTYTTFEIKDTGAPKRIDDLDQPIDVTAAIRNTGSRAGTEVVQIYARHLDAAERRPDRELIGFSRVSLDPGQTESTTILLDTQGLATWSEQHERWVIRPGRYELLIGTSSEAIHATLPLELTVGDLPAHTFTLDDVFADITDDPQGRAVTEVLVRQFGHGDTLAAATADDHFASFLANLPFRKLKNLSGGKLDDAAVQRLLDLVNSDTDPEDVPQRMRAILANARPRSGG